MGDASLEREALDFHSTGRPGKIEIVATKPMATQRDLALAYSPGVAAPVQAIAADPDAAYDYTAKGNLVAVITNGTAILGLGNLGALASKPVMEGKAVLFKRFADRSEEHTSELQSLMRISYAVFCLKKKTTYNLHTDEEYKKAQHKNNTQY